MKKIIYIITVLFTTFLLFSCDSTFELLAQKEKSIKMDLHKDIIVTTCRNGFYNDKEYKKSGKKTTSAIYNKLRPYASTVTITEEDSFGKISKDKLLNCDYVIVPDLFLWEDRATSISFLPDKMIIALSVYDNTGNMINRIEIKGESTKATVATNDPIDLVNEAMDMYIRQLFNLY